MIPILSHLSLPPKHSLSILHIPFPRYKHKSRRYYPVHSLPNNPYYQQRQSHLLSNEDLPRQQQQQQQPQQPPRTVFPGGYKRPEIKVPCILLYADSDDVLNGGDDVLEAIDKAVAESVGIVVLNAGDVTGKRLYEAARALKSVVRDRAYLLISERVDVAAAVNANGVLLSDQGLPAIVARNMMLGSQYESVVLPLVAKTVETPHAALNATKSEGADFLMYISNRESNFDVEMKSVFRDVKIPIFVSVDSEEERLRFLKSGCSGLAVSLKGLRLIGSDGLTRLLETASVNERIFGGQLQSIDEVGKFDVENESYRRERTAGFVKLADREKQLVEKEKTVLREAISVIQKAAPLMEEISLLIDAVSQIDEPFMLAIVGEFNSGKSTVINALLGERYLKEGVVPTTNEITFLRYSNYNEGEQQRCERHPDGQYICYLPAPVLKEMIIVDTPGTNVILQRQQRLTEEFVPRADLLLFVISADRPLTESEVSFLRYTQQWKKKVVFVLNKADIYSNSSELEEAISFIKENTKKLLNSEDVTLYPVSARSALEAKLSASSDNGDNGAMSLVLESDWRISSFTELEEFLYSFLDGSTRTGLERMKLKLGTPVAIAERLLSSCETLVKQECRLAKQDLAYANELIGSVKEYAMKIKNDSISWRRRTLSLIDATKSQALELVKSTLLLSNLDLAAAFVFKGETSAMMPVTMKIQNEIITPGLTDTQKLLGEYLLWLQSNNAREGKLYEESFAKRWPSFTNTSTRINMETYELFKKSDDLSLKVIENFNTTAVSKLFEKELREVFLGTFGGLGAAGLSASLLTSVLPTAMEDLLALGLCSAGGYIAVMNFPARRQKMLEKVNKIADAFAQEVEEAMQKDLLERIENLESFVKAVGKPYQAAAQEKLDKLLGIQEEVSNIEKETTTLQVEIQNLHV